MSEGKRGGGEEGVEVVREQLKIQMDNGDVLFGKVWRPQVLYPVPCVRFFFSFLFFLGHSHPHTHTQALEYIPYGCGATTVTRDEQRLAYFASQGIAVCWCWCLFVGVLLVCVCCVCLLVCVC